MNKTPRAHKPGFTLIELLLALSIFSVIALSLYSTFATGMTLSKRSERTDEVYRQVRWTLERVSLELERMVNYDLSGSAPDKLAFVGEADQIVFIVPSDPGLKMVKYSLEPLEFGSVHKTLIGKHYKRNEDMVLLNEKSLTLNAFTREEMDIVDYLSGKTPEKPNVSVLNSKVKQGGLKFLYAFRQGTGDEVKIIWKNQWGQKGIPAGVQVELTFIDSEQKEAVSTRRNVFIPAGILGETSL